MNLSDLDVCPVVGILKWRKMVTISSFDLKLYAGEELDIILTGGGGGGSARNSGSGYSHDKGGGGGEYVTITGLKYTDHVDYSSYPLNFHLGSGGAGGLGNGGHGGTSRIQINGTTRVSVDGGSGGDSTNPGVGGTGGSADSSYFPSASFTAGIAGNNDNGGNSYTEVNNGYTISGGEGRGCHQVGDMQYGWSDYHNTMETACYGGGGGGAEGTDCDQYYGWDGQAGPGADAYAIVIFK